MIQVSSLSKSYGSKELFEDVSFSINSGERIGLVGRNGDGKSTFFKILLAQEEADSGDISFPSGYRVGHLSQHLSFSCSTSLEEALLEGRTQLKTTHLKTTKHELFWKDLVLERKKLWGPLPLSQVASKFA